MHAPQTHEAFGAFHPMGHMGEMSDIVDAILYLDAAPFVTGEILYVDGGQSAGHKTYSSAAGRRSFASIIVKRNDMPIVTIQITREATRPGTTSVTAEEKA